MEVRDLTDNRTFQLENAKKNAFEKHVFGSSFLDTIKVAWTGTKYRIQLMAQKLRR